MESSNQTLDVVLLASKKTYSLAKKKPIAVWKTMPYSSQQHLKVPHDFEKRLVTADINGKPLIEEFRELKLDWAATSNAESTAKKLIDRGVGLTDVALYFKQLNLAFLVVSHKHIDRQLVKVSSLDELKKEFD